MQVKQIYDLVNSVVRQVRGENAVTVTDLTGLIRLGDDIISSDTDKENFVNTLVDRIGKTIISGRVYSGNALDLIAHSFEFGAILQKIYVDPMPAKQSPTWDLPADGGYVNQYIITRPTVRQKLFTGKNTWQIDITIPDVQLKSAFESAEGMAVFIDAIFQSMRNSMELQLESMANTAYTNFIGERLAFAGDNPGTTTLAVNLLALWKTETAGNNAVTYAQAMKNMDFLKYASMQINLFRKRMARMSVLFNSEGYKRFTAADDMRVIMLADFASAAQMYLQADTFHKELVELPRYVEVPYWQGSGTGYTLADTSQIDIVTSSGEEVQQSGILCVLADIESVGIFMNNRRSRTAYNANGEYTNFWEKADMGYFNDLSENGMVFYAADPATTSP